VAFYRPKSKESSAFPKPYPLRNRAIGGEMAQTLEYLPRELADAVTAASKTNFLLVSMSKGEQI